MTLTNSEVLSELIRNVADDGEYREVSGELLRALAPIVPNIFKAKLVEITSMFHDESFAGGNCRPSLHNIL